MRKPVTLIAGQVRHSRHFRHTAPTSKPPCSSLRKRRPLRSTSAAASGDDESFGTALCGLIAAAGAADVMWPKLAQAPP